MTPVMYFIINNPMEQLISTVKAKDADSVEVGVSRVCGHDMHVIWMMGAARLFSEHRDQWKGTLMVVFQPGEEVERGAHGMIDDGMMDRFPKPDIIPEDATLTLNIRTFDDGVRDHILSAVKRICCAECAPSDAPRDPEFTTLDSYPIRDNDVAATANVAEAFDAQFGDRSFETAPASASEDLSVFGRNWKVPYVCWFVGGTDPEIYKEAKMNNKINTIPSNHSPKFAPVINPTLKMS